MVGDNVYSVPCFMDVLAFWVDEEKMANAGLTEIKTKEDLKNMQKLIHRTVNTDMEMRGKKHMYLTLSEHL